MFLKAEAKFLIVISRVIAGSVFAYIDDFKKLDGIFFFPNTKALGKFEFKCLMSYIFANEFQKFLRGYQFLQMNPMRETSQISILKMPMFQVNELQYKQCRVIPHFSIGQNLLRKY